MQKSLKLINFSFFIQFRGSLSKTFAMLKSSNFVTSSIFLKFGSSMKTHFYDRLLLEDESKAINTGYKQSIVQENVAFNCKVGHNFTVSLYSNTPSASCQSSVQFSSAYSKTLVTSLIGFVF